VRPRYSDTDTDAGLGGDIRERDMAAFPQHQGDL
jgi:hypothetical protein